MQQYGMGWVLPAALWFKNYLVFLIGFGVNVYGEINVHSMPYHDKIKH